MYIFQRFVGGGVRMVDVVWPLINVPVLQGLVVQGAIKVIRY